MYYVELPVKSYTIVGQEKPPFAYTELTFCWTEYPFPTR